MSDVDSVKKYMKEKIPYVEIFGRGREFVQNKDGKIFAVYKLYGIDDKMRDDEIERRANALSQFVSTFEKRYEFTFDFVRLQKRGNNYDENINVSNELKNSLKIRDKRINFFKETFLFENIVYFSLCFSWRTKSQRVLTADLLEEFCDNLISIETNFSSFGFEHQRLKKDELYLYLYRSLTNNFYEEGLKIPLSRLDEALSNQIDFIPSAIPLIINEETLLQTVTLKNLPYETSIKSLNPLLNVPFNIRVIYKYNSYDFSQSESAISKKRDDYIKNIFTGKALVKQVLSNERSAISQESEIDMSSYLGKEGCQNALIYKKENNVSSGIFSVSIYLSAYMEKFNEAEIVRAEKNLDSKFKYLVQELQNVRSLGVKIEKEKKTNTLCFLSNFIGSFTSYNANHLHCMSDNACDLLPLSSMSEKYNSPYFSKIVRSKEPLLFGIKKDKSLFSFSPFGEKEFGHTFISAPTRSGKSILLSLMANEFLKYKRTKVIYFDIDLSCLRTVRENGGVLYYPLSDNNKYNTSFQPFKNAKDNKDDCIKFIEAIAHFNNFSVSSDERLILSDIFEKASDTFLGKEKIETIRSIAESRIQNSDLIKGLKQYEEEAGGLFNSDNDSFDNLGRISGIEMGKLMSASDIIKYPTLVYLLNKIEKQISYTNPTMIIIDEAWKFLRDKYFSAFIMNWLKTLAKKDCFVLIATQEINDLITSDIANTILENSQTRIYLKNSKSEEKLTRENYEMLGLDGDEINIIGNMPDFWCYLKQDEKRILCDFCADVVLEELKTTEDEKRDVRVLEKERSEQ